ncbi:MAG: hypothetical protein HYU75_21275 [Betaproteobacteria bacterium]|nr:hypothetical protein [Betaproteobacteria bacterium]
MLGRDLDASDEPSGRKCSHRPTARPRAVIDKLYGELALVLKSPDLKERVAQAGYDTSEMGLPPAEFAGFLRSSVTKWTQVTKDLKIRAK